MFLIKLGGNLHILLLLIERNIVNVTAACV